MIFHRFVTWQKISRFFTEKATHTHTHSWQSLFQGMSCQEGSAFSKGESLCLFLMLKDIFSSHIHKWLTRFSLNLPKNIAQVKWFALNISAGTIKVWLSYKQLQIGSFKGAWSFPLLGSTTRPTCIFSTYRQMVICTYICILHITDLSIDHFSKAAIIYMLTNAKICAI